MLYIRPDYYSEFSCAADACEDTCCAGWQIVVDQRSLQRYKKAAKNPSVSKEFRERLKRGVDSGKAVFRQKGEKRCAFLNNRNLCDLYTELGRNSLCSTCRRYPRHVEEFENVREITLSLSCPEVAKLLMNRMEPVRFISAVTDQEETYDDYDPLLYSQLADAREVMLSMLKDRSLSLSVREHLLFGIAHDIQNRVNAHRLFDCQNVLEKYQKASAVQFVKEKIKEEEKDEEALFCFLKTNFRKLFSLELLNQDWDVLLLEVERYLYLGKTAQEYENLTYRFKAWLLEQEFPWEIQKEQILTYFIYTYFCGAVYDGEVLGKVRLALYSAEMLEEILKSRWIKNEGMLTVEEVVDVAYRYAREVEHSDLNLKKMEEFAWK